VNLIKTKIGEFPKKINTEAQANPATEQEKYKGFLIRPITLFNRISNVHNVDLLVLR
jgi:hypothetical protein